MTRYYRPLVQSGPARPETALALAGGPCWFSHVEVLDRTAPPNVMAADALPDDWRAALTMPRQPIAGLTLDRPRIMGILNVTPDSFSDGGLHDTVPGVLRGADAMQAADILDIGGESTRPGAETVPDAEEIARVVPAITALRQAGHRQPISIDTRKTAVAHAAIEAGADMVNDVAGFTFDAGLAPLCAHHGLPVCVMHAQGDPQTMQADPRYDDVLLDVYDWLSDRIAVLVGQGIPRERIVADPGIGFGKTLDHNLALIARLSLFHGLGVPLLLGASRKRFIGTIGKAEAPRDRMPGSIAVAIAALQHGTQIVRVHDVAETAQAIALWRASVAGEAHE
ncbi:dihydropteroate synthase [Sulfitobacter sp. D35]|uniref:dihydropteroate synthase n=1 Tax=Sulfitobacter sp. D35 TaxID=3083252 RepID=UPI00296EB45D|nr:dihydropteroate synthase [Sulfitobacter sp. D35]MDW4499877.1 dihydropteroate synthase [Sulfitobacter sp. D35]